MLKPFFGAFAFVAAFFLPLVRGIARPLSLCGSSAKQSFRPDRARSRIGTAVIAARRPVVARAVRVVSIFGIAPREIKVASPGRVW